MMRENINVLTTLYRDIITTSKYIESRAQTYINQIEFLSSNIVKEMKTKSTQTDHNEENSAIIDNTIVDQGNGNGNENQLQLSNPNRCPIGKKLCPSCKTYQKVARKTCQHCNHTFYSKRKAKKLRTSSDSGASAPL